MSQGSIVVRAWSGFWRFVDGTRRLVLNLLFLLIVALLLLWIFSSEPVTAIPPGSALLINPQGDLVEEYTGDPFDRALQEMTDSDRIETRVRDLVRAIRRAATDDRIGMLVIDPDELGSAGLASLGEIEHAVAAFRDSGKPVVAAVRGVGQNGYYLAALADEVWLDPYGLVWLDGFATYRNYYKDGLDQLEVEVNLFRAGEYKSAQEPLVRNDMSEEAREANLYWIGGLWQQYLEGVSRHRGIPLETLSGTINDLPGRVVAAGGDFARHAREAGLVDRLVAGPELRQELARQGVSRNDAGELNLVGFETYLGATDTLPVMRPGAVVTVVAAEGSIMSGDRPPGEIGSGSMATQLREIGRDGDVAAVVLRIDSPGGEALASEVIRREIQALRDGGKTVVVSMGDVAASGGYWIAMAADEVWASPATITGSIGVYGVLPTFGATLDRIGVSTDGVGTTPHAGRLRLDMPLDDDLRQVFQASVEETYRRFIGLVAEQRDMSPDEVREVARGRVWSGAQAAERGLVDRVGTLDEAIDSAARIAGLGDDFDLRWAEPRVTPFERFLLDIARDVSVSTDGWRPPALLGASSLLERVRRDLESLAPRDDAFAVAAHCLCGVE